MGGESDEEVKSRLTSTTCTSEEEGDEEGESRGEVKSRLAIVGHPIDQRQEKRPTHRNAKRFVHQYWLFARYRHKHGWQSSEGGGYANAGNLMAPSDILVSGECTVKQAGKSKGSARNIIS